MNSQRRSFFRQFRYVGKYKRFVALNMGFNILTTIFSVVSITAIYPFLQLLFGLEQAQTASLENLGWSAADLLRRLNYYLSQLIAQQGKEQALLIVSIGVVGIFFLKNLTRYLAMFFLAPVRNGVVRDLRTKLFGKMTALPLAWYSEEKKGDLMARITADVQEVEWSILSTLEIIAREPLMILISLIVLVSISPALTGVVAVLVLVMVFLLGSIRKTLKKPSREAQKQLGALLAVVEETLGGLRIVKGFNAEGYATEKFQNHAQDHLRAVNFAFRRRDLSSPLTEFLGIAIMAMLLWFGARLVFSGTMDGALFITYLMTFYNVITPAKSLTTASFSIQKGLAASERIDAILDEPLRIEEKRDAAHKSSFEHEIHYQNVSFSYPQRAGVLQNIDLRIPKGKVIALVGASGAGKSTIADLLPRFYEVSDGALLIDGVDVRDMRLKDLRALIGIVSQDAILFNDSIHNNIAFGFTADRAQVEAAAKVANAYDFILQTEAGFDTVIGDRGQKLSGGQRQRLTIARAVLRNPPILILDEATSALDTEAEQAVQAALQNVMKDRTALIIAHRLSTVMHADEVVVLHAGKIIERGAPAALAATPGSAFARLLALQGL